MTKFYSGAATVMICAIVAGALCYLGKDGWGWFLGLGFLVAIGTF